MLDIATEGANDAARAMADAPGLREAAIVRLLATGQQASTARMGRVDGDIAELKTLIQAALYQMTATLGDLSGRMGHLEEQPLPGGPMARAVEKSHALAARREERGAHPTRLSSIARWSRWPGGCATLSRRWRWRRS